MTEHRTPSLAGSSGKDSPRLTGWGIAAYQDDQGDTKMATYWELLKDPRWQKVRLKKLEAAEWLCEACYDAETTLSVHHKRYVKGRKPWEYESHELVVLCQPCHEMEHEAKDQRSELIAHLHQDGPASATDFFAIGAGYLSVQTNDEGLHEATRPFFQDNPYQFECGRLLAGLMSRFHITIDGLQSLADALENDAESAFVDDIAAVLAKHGALVQRPEKDGA